MKKSLKKTLAGVALVAVMALGGAGAASAEQNGPVTTTLQPGGRTCLTTSFLAFYRMQADGTAVALPGQIQWTVQSSRDGYTFQTLSQTSTNTSYTANLDYRWSPGFPGYFKFCARNVSTAWTAKVTMTLKTDSNVT